MQTSLEYRRKGRKEKSELPALDQDEKAETRRNNRVELGTVARKAQLQRSGGENLMQKINVDRIATFDIESNHWVDFEVLGFFDGETYKTFSRLDKFLEYLETGKRYNGWSIFAHNGGKFDFLFLIEPMMRRGWTFSISERQGRVMVLEVKAKRSKFSFFDSYSLLPSSLADLCKAFGVPHQKETFDFSRHRVSKSDPKLMKRLENDCKGLREILLSFYGSDYITNPQVTIASQALDTFRNSFGADVVSLPAEHEDVFRESFYAGGRVEVYKGWSKGVRSYDVNSLFPYAMLEPMPVGDCRKVRTYKPGLIGFYKVRIRTTPNWYITPLLVKGDKNMFVKGAGEYFISSRMLEYLKLEYGVRCEVEWGFVFSGAEPILRDYVNTFYKLKAENRGNAMYYIAKLFLNALYGKFAQNRDKYRIETFNGQNNFIVMEGEIAQRLHLVLIPHRSQSRFILPYLSAWITDLARLYHFRLMQEHPRDMFYCDTDSLFTTARYPVGDKIGQLSYKGTFEGCFLNSKTYALRNSTSEEIRFKGFNASEFRFRDFMNLLKGKTKTLMQTTERILTYRQCLTRVNGITYDRGLFLKLVNQEKESACDYDKRLMVKSDRFIFDTKPFDFHR